MDTYLGRLDILPLLAAPHSLINQFYCLTNSIVSSRIKSLTGTEPTCSRALHLARMSLKFKQRTQTWSSSTSLYSVPHWHTVRWSHNSEHIKKQAAAMEINIPETWSRRSWTCWPPCNTLTLLGPAKEVNMVVKTCGGCPFPPLTQNTNTANTSARALLPTVPLLLDVIPNEPKPELPAFNTSRHPAAAGLDFNTTLRSSYYPADDDCRCRMILISSNGYVY